MTKWRGSTVALFCPAVDVQALLSHGANVIRYPLVDADPAQPVGELNDAGYKQWVRTHLDHIDNVILPVLGNAKIIINLHSPPGGMVKQSGRLPQHAMFDTRLWAKQTFKDVWLEIATRYLGNSKVLAFDLLNEGAGTSQQILTLMRHTIKTIRVINRLVPCIVSCPFGDPARANGFKVIPQVAVWYTVHFYSPLNVSHQGIGDFPAPKPYPGPNTGKARMVKDLEVFKKFIDDNKLHAFIGEFSISTAADQQSRANYLDDITDILESNKWDYCYHSWRESPWWNLEGYDLPFNVMKEKWGKNVL